MADDSEWVLESIAGYLGSPEWVIPVTDFMENKCTVFDDEDENKLTYTEIHQQYKQLVEKLLESYMQEVGINEQQFLEACSSPYAKSKALQAVFQPVVATDDFQMFRSLMVQKNVELQLQALRVIKERNGALPECLTDGTDVVSELEQEEMRILQEVLKRSKEEYDLELERRMVLKEEQLELGSTSGSERTPKDIGSHPTHGHSQENQDREAGGGEQSVLWNQPKVSPAGPAEVLPGQGRPDHKALPAVTVTVEPPPPEAETKEKARNQAAEAWLEEARREAGISQPFTELTMAQQEQLQQRAHYLRQQRDKLQALKKNQKAKASAPEETALAPVPSPPEISVEERKRLQKRKHLAEKLKEEVIRK